MNGVTTRISGVTILRQKVVGDHFCRVFVDLLTSKKDCTNFFIGIMSHWPMPNHWILPFGCFVFFWCLLLQIFFLFVGRDESSPFLWIWISAWMRGNQKMTKFIFVIVRANIALLVSSFSKPTPNHQTTPTCRSLFEIYQLTAVSHIWTSHLKKTPNGRLQLGVSWGKVELRGGGVNLHGWSQVQGF